MHRLTIEKANGNCLNICGTEEVLSDELEAWTQFEHVSNEEWKQAEQSGREYRNYDQYKVRRVTGMANDATRSEVIVAYRLCDVIGMTLVEL